mmetsp:Transcript_14500/g.34763  ORF Transcript_14500/g.34763 Transcript_14500/m.34763 type:complete len:471 (+) Transcript_14500:112-1524(+)
MFGTSFYRTVATIALLVSTANANEAVGVHGSGTTNPSKCYWAIMEQIEARTKADTHLTYRAVGSTTGIAEFVNDYDTTEPVNDFGSGDLPLNNTVWTRFNSTGVKVLQFPVLLGAVSFFHSVKYVDKLDLNACLLARIFRRDIKEWTHPDIVAFNPELADVPVDEDMSIIVAHRVRGSSSTSSITNYLNVACPDEWSDDLVGSRITWPDDTKGCEGSGGMTDCINNDPNVIGYIDAGHGIAEGLSEIELENKDGTLLSSQEASARGGIAAAEQGALPDSVEADFSGVSLLNRPGEYTWPIVLMTYVYVRQDMTYFDDAAEASLTVAFLEALYNDDYIQQCADNYGFTLPTSDVRDMAEEGIKSLILPDGAPKWTFESSTDPIDGHGEYVISGKRQRISDIERDSLMSSSATKEELEQEIAALKAELNDKAGMTDKQERQLMAALVLSCMCFVYLIIFSIFPLLRCFSRKE